MLLLVRLFAAGLRAVERRAVVPDFFAAAGFAAAPVVREADAALAFVAVERLAAGLRRAAVLRAGLRVAVERLAAPVDEDADVDVELAEPSIENLPDITRCAASATASAISEPSLVALDMTDFAALASLSVVLLLVPLERDEERDDEDLEEPFRVLDFAICKPPLRSPHLHLA